MKGLLNKLDNGIVVTDKKGMIYYCNPKLLIEINKDLEDVKGTFIQDMVENIHLESMNTDRIYAYLNRGNGSKKYVSIEKIEEQWEAQSAYYFVLQDVNADFEYSVIDRSGLCIWVKDQKGKFCYANKQFLKGFVGGGYAA